MQPRLYAGIMPHTAVRTNNPIGKVVIIPALCNTLLGKVTVWPRKMKQGMGKS